MILRSRVVPVSRARAKGGEKCQRMLARASKGRSGETRTVRHGHPLASAQDLERKRAMQNMMSRRSFVGAAGAATVAAGVASSVVCASAEEAAEAPVMYGFEQAPEPVADEDIAEIVDCDILVVGGGISGLCTAVRAAELAQGSLSVVLISASSQHVERGGSFHGIDTKIQRERGINYTPETMGRLIKLETMNHGYRNDMRKWSRWIQNSAESMNWLIDKMTSYGAEVTLELPFKDNEGLLDLEAGAHNFVLRDESKLKENGGIFSELVENGAITGVILVGDMYQYELENILGCRVDWQTKAEYLIREDNNTGRVSGVVASNSEGQYVRYNASKAVVLATGDFSTNYEMVQKYSPWLNEQGMLYYNGTNYDNTNVMGGIMPGDGQKMGLWVGAAWQKGPVSANIVAISGCQNRANASPATIALNKDGVRFYNEDATYSMRAYAAIEQPQKTTFEIWDADYANHYDIWNMYGVTLPLDDGWVGCSFLSRTPEEELQMWDESVGNGFFKADTLDELLAQLEAEGLNAEAAKASIERYNGYCADGFDPEFLKNPAELVAIENGPFYAFKLEISPFNFLTVLGGLSTDEHMRVLDANDMPIEGLYNVGAMIGDMYGAVYTFNIAGQSLGAACTTFPYLLAQELVEQA